MINTPEKIEAAAEFAEMLSRKFLSPACQPWGALANGVVHAVMQETEIEAEITGGEDVSNPAWKPPAPPE